MENEIFLNQRGIRDPKTAATTDRSAASPITSTQDSATSGMSCHVYTIRTHIAARTPANTGVLPRRAGQGRVRNRKHSRPRPPADQYHHERGREVAVAGERALAA
jgi:hypothetical protein